MNRFSDYLFYNPHGSSFETCARIEYNSGVKEEPKGSNSGARVDMYLEYAGVTTPNSWCAAFVNWCLGQNDIKGAGALGANYLTWGTKLEDSRSA